MYNTADDCPLDARSSARVLSKSGCPYHNRKLARTSPWYYHHGSFASLARGKTRRFRCKHCGTTSSTQTFSINYWTHLPINLRDLDERLNSCAGYRQIARALGVSYPVIKNRTLRLSRNYLNLFDTSLVNFPSRRTSHSTASSLIFGVSTSRTTSISPSAVPHSAVSFHALPFPSSGRMTDVQRRTGPSSTLSGVRTALPRHLLPDRFPGRPLALHEPAGAIPCSSTLTRRPSTRRPSRPFPSGGI